MLRNRLPMKSGERAFIRIQVLWLANGGGKLSVGVEREKRNHKLALVLNK